MSLILWFFSKAPHIVSYLAWGCQAEHPFASLCHLPFTPALPFNRPLDNPNLKLHAAPMTDTSMLIALAQDEAKLDLFESFISTDDKELSIAVAQVPSLFGISDLATYMGYRALGLTTTQALIIMDADEDLLIDWKEQIPVFQEFEQKALPMLQRYAAKEIVRIGFLRNMALYIAKDHQIANKALISLNALSKQEYELYKNNRKHYTNNDLLAMEKIISPEDFKGDTVIQLNWGQQNIEVIEGVEVEYASSSPS